MTDQAVSFGQPEQILIRTLLYPVIFESKIMDGIDRVIRLTQEQPTGASEEQMLEAIRRALASDFPLEKILPQPHPDAAIRAFLRELERRLVSG